MEISLIIPTLNAGECLGELLSRLLSQDTKPSEIIIIDSSSGDDTVNIAKRFGARTIVIPKHAFSRGYKIAYVPEAKVIHYHNYSLFDQFRRYYNIGSSLRQNTWILKYAVPEREGMKFVREQIKYVIRQHKYIWIPYIFMESLAKYAGYRIGLISG